MRIILKNRAQFNCSGQTRDSWTTSQNKKTVMDHPHTVLRTKGAQTFEGGYFNNLSYFLLSCGLNINIFYAKYLTQDSTKKNMHFVKIIHIFCKGFTNFRMPLYIDIQPSPTLYQEFLRMFRRPIHMSDSSICVQVWATNGRRRDDTASFRQVELLQFFSSYVSSFMAMVSSCRNDCSSRSTASVPNSLSTDTNMLRKTLTWLQTLDVRAGWFFWFDRLIWI